MNNKKELIDLLMKKFDIHMPEKTKKYIGEHFDNYFDDTFFSDLQNTVTWKIEAVQFDAESDMAFEEKHAKDKVELVKEAKVMWFNDNSVPAYWYRDDMTDDEINTILKYYKDRWIKSEIENLKYPELEFWHDIKDWEAEFSEEQLQKMERDLECMDNEDAQELNFARIKNVPVDFVSYHYPIKIMKIVDATDKVKDKNGVMFATVTLLLKDGRTCRVRVHSSKNGSVSGMEAIDGGFPIMTNKDNQKIENEVFSRWEKK